MIQYFTATNNLASNYLLFRYYNDASAIFNASGTNAWQDFNVQMYWLNIFTINQNDKKNCINQIVISGPRLPLEYFRVVIPKL